MSQVKLNPKDEGNEVIVGWDRPLNTYFIQVWAPAPEDETIEHWPVVFDSQWTPAKVVEMIDEHAVNDDLSTRVKEAILAGQDPEQAAS